MPPTMSVPLLLERQGALAVVMMSITRTEAAQLYYIEEIFYSRTVSHHLSYVIYACWDSHRSYGL